MIGGYDIAINHYPGMACCEPYIDCQHNAKGTDKRHNGNKKIFRSVVSEFPDFKQIIAAIIFSNVDT